MADETTQEEIAPVQEEQPTTQDSPIDWEARYEQLKNAFERILDRHMIDISLQSEYRKEAGL